MVYDDETHHLLLLLNMMKCLSTVHLFSFSVLFMKTESKRPIEQRGLWLLQELCYVSEGHLVYCAASGGCMGDMEPGEEAGLRGRCCKERTWYWKD